MYNDNYIYSDNQERISLIQFSINNGQAENLLQVELNLNSSYPESIQQGLMRCLARAYAEAVINESTSISLFENTVIFLSDFEQSQVSEIKSKQAEQLKDMIIDEMIDLISSALDAEFVFSDNWYDQTNNLQVKLSGLIAGRSVSLGSHQDALSNIQSISNDVVRKIAEHEYIRSSHYRSDEFYQFLLSNETTVAVGKGLFMAAIAGGVNEEPVRVSQVINDSANGIRRDCAIAAMLSIIIDEDREGALIWLDEIDNVSIKQQISGFLNI